MSASIRLTQKWDKETVVNFPLGYLFDDEEPNRKKWLGVAYDVNNIIEVLKNLKNF